jgi:RNase H-fold protein (predicted Holliday junction resolvase)
MRFIGAAMTIASCIEKFKSVIDIDLLRGMAKTYEDKGMSPDTAMVRVATEEITRLTKDRKDVVDMVAPKKEAAAKEEVTQDQFTKQAARGLVESDPAMIVVDESGKQVAAKDMLDQAEVKFQQETKDADLFKVAVACAIGVGE